MQAVDKIYVLVLLVGLIAACAAGSKPTAEVEPSWYAQRTVTPAPGKIIGYGCGPTPKFARTMAVSEISEQVKVWVKSETLLARGKNKEAWQEKYQDVIEASSREMLGDLFILKEEQRGNMFYIVLEGARPSSGFQR